MSKYSKAYYRKNKESIKAKSKARYHEQKQKQKEVKKSMSSVIGVANEGELSSSPGSINNSYFNVYGKSDPNKAFANTASILRQFSGWIYTCAAYNGASVANQNLRLYATSENGESTDYLHKSKPVNNDMLHYMHNAPSLKSITRLRRSDEVVEIVDHPILDLLNNVNSYNNGFETMEKSSIYLDMCGNCHWYIQKDAMKTPIAIWVLRSEQMNIIPGKTKWIKAYEYGVNSSYGNTGNTKAKRFSTDSIIHFKTPSVASQFMGYGPAQAALTAINRMNAYDTTEMAKLDNNGRPDGIVKYKNGKIDSEERKKFQRMWGGAFGGPNKQGKMQIFDEDWELVETGWAPREMEFLSGRIQTLKEMSSIFGIPFNLLDPTDSKKSGSEVSNQWYQEHAVLPRITRIEQKLNEQLIPMFDPSGRLFVLYDNPISEDRALLLKENVENIKNKIISVNEARMRIQLPPIDDPKFDIPGGVEPDKAKATINGKDEIKDEADSESVKVDENEEIDK